VSLYVVANAAKEMQHIVGIEAMHNIGEDYTVVVLRKRMRSGLMSPIHFSFPAIHKYAYSMIVVLDESARNPKKLGLYRLIVIYDAEFP
jgi:hypothetical protein